MMKRFILLIICPFFLCRCEYLDVVPVNDIQTIETIFEKREEAARWLKTCYYFLSEPIASVVYNPAYTGADEVVSGEYIRTGNYINLRMPADWQGLFIADGLQMSQEPYGNIWKRDGFYAGIRYCNIFFENIGRTYGMTETEKGLWTAELKALKAHFYFELMRRYGPIILVPENIAANADIEVMQQPRRPIDTCVNEMVRLLDEAMKALPPLAQKEQLRWTFHSLESAAALKAQILLYAASPMFNGNPSYANFTNKKGEQLFSQKEDPEKWKIAAEAADEAIRICLNGGKKLIEGHADKMTPLLNTMQDIENSLLASNFENDESLFMVKPQNMSQAFWDIFILPSYPTGTTDYMASNIGSISPSMKMVEMYYTVNGLPIDQDREWDYASRYQMSRETNPKYRDVVPLNTPLLALHLGREPRFYANIAADRLYWKRGAYPMPGTEFVQVYQGERYGSQIDRIDPTYRQNLSGYYMKKSLKSNLSNMENLSYPKEATIVMRLAELYLMKAEAWNEYEGPVNPDHVYAPLNEVRRRAGIPDLEIAWTNYSKNPDKIKTKAGMRDVIRQEWNIEFAFEGRRFWNLRRWLTAADELNVPLYGWNILGKTAQEFYNNYDGPVPVWTKREFVAPRDYLFPIRSEEVLISGCEQNPGW
ncbi:RagB/SusD family nutrient uptake outer membrane protein [Butyricimonas sp.]|uniref:RagB/SusD family nutrient uptake outer membrane protein n=1 Tax=Butyricimonas sp. TaxID=1969738 RepID=UPI0034526E32